MSYEAQTRKAGRALQYINDTPELLSLLYDLDLLPEQVTENTRDWMRMLQLQAWHEWLRSHRPTARVSDSPAETST